MKSMSRNEIATINRQTNDRYNARLREKGPGVFALGWGKRSYQLKRFNDLVHAVGKDFFHGKRVVDIGCGLGDLYSYLRKQNIRPKRYLGVDVNEEFISYAKKDFAKDSRVVFEKRDLMLKPLTKGKAEVGVALGVINFKQKNHEAYAKRFIEACFDSVSEAVVINVISAVRNADYLPESRIYYYDPSEWLAWAQKHLTPFASLIHDYAGEPQHEFFLILRKQPWKK